jgi:putative transcriptional regulator
MKNRLKIERAILDLTQEELSNKIGVSRQTISSIEKNRYIPSTVLSLRLSNLFNKPVNDFFELDENETANA